MWYIHTIEYLPAIKVKYWYMLQHEYYAGEIDGKDYMFHDSIYMK